MKQYEELMEKALCDSKDAFEELLSNAGGGNAEAQYYLALYYQEVAKSDLIQETNYQYWMQKAINNGYDEAIAKTILNIEHNKSNYTDNNKVLPQKESIESYQDTSNKEFGSSSYRPNFSWSKADKDIHSSTPIGFKIPPNHVYQEGFWERFGKTALYVIISYIVLHLIREC